MYTIEIVNGVWTSVKTKDDMFWFLDNKCPSIGRFKTQKAAREFLERNGFIPYGFKHRGKPFMYHSQQYGMEAHIKDAETDLLIIYRR